jgi:hypothetical protein
VLADADLHAAVATGGADELLIDQPVRSSTNLVMANAANTMLRWASIDSRLW